MAKTKTVNKLPIDQGTRVRRMAQNIKLLYSNFAILWAIHNEWNLALDQVRIITINKQMVPNWLKKMSTDFRVYIHYYNNQDRAGLKGIPATGLQTDWANKILLAIDSGDNITEIILDDPASSYHNILIYSSRGFSLNELLKQTAAEMAHENAKKGAAS
jgi:hypothetical protein